MIPIKVFNEQEKKALIRKLEIQFGIKEINFNVAKIGKERLVLFSGNLSEKEIENLDRIARVEVVGVYFAKEQNDELRLSIEGVQLLKEQITKNIFELDEAQVREWMLGQDLNIATGKRGFFIMKYKEDFLGTGKASESKISNFIPKSRRLRYKENQTEERLF